MENPFDVDNMTGGGLPIAVPFPIHTLQPKLIRRYFSLYGNLITGWNWESVYAVDDLNGFSLELPSGIVLRDMLGITEV